MPRPDRPDPPMHFVDPDPPHYRVYDYHGDLRPRAHPPVVCSDAIFAAGRVTTDQSQVTCKHCLKISVARERRPRGYLIHLADPTRARPLDGDDYTAVVCNDIHLSVTRTTTDLSKVTCVLCRKYATSKTVSKRRAAHGLLPYLAVA